MSLRLERYDFSQSEEAVKFVALVKEYFPKSPWHPTVENLKTSGIIYYRAFNQETQIGVTGYSPKTPHLAETVKTFVFNEFRNKGYGKLLSKAIEDECHKQGYRKIMTTIFHDNLSMIQIKLKQGYIIEGFHRDHEALGFHEYSLGKVLL